MGRAQTHRGPDSEGLHVDAGVALGVRRLAIIDVPGGNQPIANEDGSIVVVMNGEIYNFADLRRRLEGRGHRFSTGSDTEVLVHLYEERGTALVHELRGMFAFALWDGNTRRLVLARDRVGKKPLYWYERDGRLSFASELAALLEDGRIPRRANPQAIDAYLSLLYVPHPLSAIEGVRKLPPASTLVWEDGRVQTDRYWRLDFGHKDPGNRDEQRERILDHLREAVRLRLVSERPLGAFLSGGVDSSAVVAMMAQLSSGAVKTFSIGFTSDRFDELPYARRVAQLFSTDHTEHVVEPDAISILPRLITHYGDPFADSSAVPSFHVAQIASREVTVALNGDGGDESFAGYNRYVSGALAERLGGLPAGLLGPMTRVATVVGGRATTPDAWSARVERLLRSVSEDGDRGYSGRMLYTSRGLRDELYAPEFAAAVETAFAENFLADAWHDSTASSAVDRMLDVDIATYLPGDLLVKMDIASMASSLEARSPFLDHRLMEMAARLPPSAKVRGLTTKAALKDAVATLVPEDLLRRPKQGFSVPLADWMRGRLGGVARDVLLDRRTRERDSFRPHVVERLLDEHAAERADRSSALWALLVLELWHRRFVDGAEETALL